MGKYAYVYKPMKEVEDYYPYFTFEEDENILNCGYLLKDTEIEINSPLGELVIEGIENK